MAQEDRTRNSFALESDPRFSDVDDSPSLKPSRQMLAQEMKQAAEEFERPVVGLLLSELSAGLGVGISFFLIATIATLASETLPQLVVEILMANAFAVGFIIVILGRMGVLSWLITGGRDTTSQILFVWVITAAIGLTHLHHSITGTAEMSAAFFVGASTSGDLLHFLLWTMLGNALGGILFAVSVVSSLHMRHKEAPESVKQATTDNAMD